MWVMIRFRIASSVGGAILWIRQSVGDGSALFDDESEEDRR